MQNTPKIVFLLNDYIAKHTREKAIDKIGIGNDAIDNIIYQRRIFHKLGVINRLYEFFEIAKDEWYYQNAKKLHRDHESVLGTFFREKRLKFGYTVNEVCKATKITDRTLLRLEAGDSLPSYNSYTILKLIDFYNLTDEEQHCIRWYIAILTDLIECVKNVEMS